LAGSFSAIITSMTRFFKRNTLMSNAKYIDLDMHEAGFEPVSADRIAAGP